jgi:predicted DNA repair protein MutK
LALAPKLMKFLSIAGTAAMFMVGGSILVHGLPIVHHAIEHSAQAVQHIAVLPVLIATIGEMLVGIVAGLAAVLVVIGVSKVLPKKAEA